MQKKMVAGIAITANKILRFQGANTARRTGTAASRRVKEGIKTIEFPGRFRIRENHLVEPVVESLRIANGRRIDLCKERNIVPPHPSDGN